MYIMLLYDQVLYHKQIISLLIPLQSPLSLIAVGVAVAVAVAVVLVLILIKRQEPLPTKYYREMNSLRPLKVPIPHNFVHFRLPPQPH